MFQAESRTHRLRRVRGGRERGQENKGVGTMNAYRFPEYSSSTSVANGVTVLVSTWFLVAAGAILTDPASPYTHAQRPVVTIENTANMAAAEESASPRLQPVAMVVSPDARFTIRVQAKRLKV
jgi:hypothetical protein